MIRTPTFGHRFIVAEIGFANNVLENPLIRRKACPHTYPYIAIACFTCKLTIYHAMNNTP